MTHAPYLAVVPGLPRSNAAIRSRRRLLRALDAAAAAPLTILRGPSGSGKTTLLRDWAESQDQPVAWISAQRVASAPDGHLSPSVRLLTAVLAGLSAGCSPAAVALFDQAAAAAAEESDPGAGLNRLAQVSEPALLILDDLHLAAEFRAEELLLDLLRVMPRLRILAGTAALGIIEQRRSLLELDVSVIGPGELAFTVSECAEALAGTRLARHSREVWEQTGGSPRWVRVLAIKSSELPRTRDKDLLSAVLAEASRDLAVLLSPPAVSAEAHDFLLAACVPVSLPETLASMLCPAETAGAMAGRAEQDGFLTRTAGGEAALVPLLRTALLAAGRKTHPARMTELEKTCAEFFLEAGRPLEALRHALGADRLDLATKVIRHQALELFTFHGPETRKLLEGVSLLKLAQQPAPAMALAVLYNSSAFRRIRGAELTALALSGARALFRSMPEAERLLLTLIESVTLRGSGQLSKSEARAKAGLRTYAEMPLAERERIGPMESVVVAHLGISLWRAEAFEEAAAAFAQAAALASAQEQPDFAGYYHSLSACICAAVGDMPGAARFLQLCRDLAWGQEEVHHYAETPLRLAEAMTALEAGNHTAAKAALAGILEQADAMELWSRTRALDAMADVLGGNPAAALAQLQGVLSRPAELPAIGKSEQATLDRLQSLLLLAAGASGQAQKTARRLPKGAGEPALARIQLACGDPQKALGTLAGLGEGKTPRQQAEICGLAIASRLQLNPGITPGLKLEIARLSALYTGFGLRLSTALLPAPDLDRVRAAALQCGLDVGIAEDAEAVISSLEDLLILTPREQAVLQTLAETGSLADIAERHFVSVNTVKSQLRGLYRKLGVSGRAEALQEAQSKGLL